MNQKILFLLFFIISGVSFAQPDQRPFLEKSSFPKKKKQKFYFKIQNENIFKNNEYSNLIEPGFTIFGSQLNTSLKYFPTSNTLIEGGIHLLYYYGTDKLNRVLPLFRFQYSPFRGLQIVFGNLFGSLNHGFIEPLFRFENIIEQPPETGLQFLYQTDRIRTDLYLNWQNYLLRNSYSEQEQFTMGFSGNFKLLKPKHKLQVEIPVQFLSTHKGGQIDTLDLPVVTLMNLVAGTRVSYHFTGFFKEVGATVYFPFYRDLSHEKNQSFNQGNGFYPGIYTKSKIINLYFFYWKANDFIAPLGEPLFSSVSTIDDQVVFPERKVLSFKIDLHHKIANGIYIGGRFESYYDILGDTNIEKTPHNDFSYGVYINFNRDFFLNKVK